jgi:hypothetical protein
VTSFNQRLTAAREPGRTDQRLIFTGEFLRALLRVPSEAMATLNAVALDRNTSWNVPPGAKRPYCPVLTIDVNLEYIASFHWLAVGHSLQRCRWKAIIASPFSGFAFRSPLGPLSSSLKHRSLPRRSGNKREDWRTYERSL